MSRLIRPAKKCFINHLKSVAKSNNFEESSAWLSEDGISFQLIWIQGVLIRDFQDSFILEDPTGQCKVIKSDTLASGLKTPVNSYIMVVGEVLKSGPQPIVKGIKVQDLSNEEALKVMWPLEVKDMQRTFR